VQGYRTRDLIPILRKQRGVCRICRGWCEGYHRCWNCQQHFQRFHGLPVPRLLAAALAVKGTALALDLWNYKYAASAEEGDAAQERLTGLLHATSQRHEACLARICEVEMFDVVTCVPSARRPTHHHPLRRLVASVSPLSERLQDTLVATGADHQHQWADGRFRVTASVEGRSILLVDDTWTSGGSAMSAALALLEAGATAAGVLVLGRHFDPTFRQGSVYSEFATSLGFDPEFCTYCDTRPYAEPDLHTRQHSR
jgi:hypothetical protein